MPFLPPRETSLPPTKKDVFSATVCRLGGTRRRRLFSRLPIKPAASTKRLSARTATSMRGWRRMRSPPVPPPASGIATAAQPRTPQPTGGLHSADSRSSTERSRCRELLARFATRRLTEGGTDRRRPGADLATFVSASRSSLAFMAWCPRRKGRGSVPRAIPRIGCRKKKRGPRRLPAAARGATPR